METSEIIFRGDFRLKIPFSGMKSVKAANGALEVRYGSETARFELGPQAEVWAHKILNPPTLMDKLGVKPGMSVALLSVSDEQFDSALGKIDLKISRGKVPSDADFIFLGAESKPELKRIAPLGRALKSNGAIWVVYPKGRKDITQAQVMEAGLATGLVDNKVCSFSATLTAIAAEIPLYTRNPSDFGGLDGLLEVVTVGPARRR